MKWITRATAACLMTVAASLAWAFPDKPVRIVIPYPPGGPTDIATRFIADRLSRTWRQPVVIENKPGASGAIGTELVAKAPADGYTLLVHSPIMIATEVMRPAVNYRVQRDFIPVTVMLTTPVVFMASNEATRGGLKDVLASGTATPGDLSYGSMGEGTSTHYLAARLGRTANVNMTHVPFAGEAPVVNALMGGHVKTGFLSGTGSRQLIETGRGRPLAVAAPQRSRLFPNVPTFAELGYPAIDRSSWLIVFAPTGTPAAVADQISRELDRLLKTPEVQQRFNELGLEALGTTVADAQREVQIEVGYWTSLLKDFGNLLK